MDRRGFLTRAGLVLGGLGVAENFKIDLMSRLARTLLPSAGASEATPPKRMIELCFRAGIPMTIFAQGKAFNNTTNLYSNFNYPNNGNARRVADGKTAHNIVYNADSFALMEFADNIALTQGIVVNPVHSNLFDYREGGPGAGKVSPAVELGNLNSTRSIMPGVIFPVSNKSGGFVSENATGGQRNLEETINGDRFRSLFQNPVLRLTASETSTVLAAAAKLSRRQALMLDAKLRDTSKNASMHANAVQLFQKDFSAELSVRNTMSSFFQRSVQTTASAQSAFEMETIHNVRENMALVLKGFELNLINSAVITVSLLDWHGYRDDRHQGAITNDLSDLLVNTIRFLKNTPDPAQPDLKLWDTTIIVAGSEFARGIAAAVGAGDNPDSATQSVMMIGKNIRGDFYGDFKLGANGQYGGELALGFDPETGEAYSAESRKRNTAEQAYHTIRAAAGLKILTSEKDKVLKAMLAG